MADALATEAAGPVTAKPRHILAAVMGNALEFYDFVTYSFFSIQIGHAFFPAKDSFVSLMLSLAALGIGFLTRPLGGWVLGWYADKVGRRASMMLSYVMMGSAITVMALIPPYAKIGLWAPVLALLARMVQGFSLGGEVGSIMAFLTEAAPTNKRGFVVSWQGASQLIAASTGSGVGLIASLLMSPHALDAYGWRIAFLLGALTVPFGLMLRRTLPETLDAPESHPIAAEPGRSSVRVVILAVMILGGGTISTYVLDYMTTFAQHSLHLGSTVAFLATMLPNAVAIPFALVAGRMSDRLGRRAVMIWPQVIYVLTILPVFFWIVGRPSGFSIVAGPCLLSMLSVIATSSFYVAFSESLPKGVRGRAVAVTYALTIATFGGTTQMVITWLIHATGRPEAAGVYMFAAAVMGLIGMCLMLESAPVRRPTVLTPAQA
jgi:MFS family permease